LLQQEDISRQFKFGRFAGYGDATELEFVVADFKFKNRDFPSEGSFGTFDCLGAVPYEHYDFA
jgi:hypothetical protein